MYIKFNMMSTYIFILGKTPDLSTAELKWRYPDAEFRFTDREMAVIDTDVKIDSAEFNKIGGSIKCAEVVAETEYGSIVTELSGVLFDFYNDSKIDYGVSVYGMPEKNLRSILLGLKKELRKNDIKSRFINNQFRNISSAQYKSIRKNGIELIAAKAGNSIFIGKVTGVQDIDAYSNRDYDKPFRDMKMGMLPPKLAQIFINLSGTDGVIWDPFCGSGTIIMEGLLMGREMMGSDIKPEHIEGAKKNVEWLINSYELKAKSYELMAHDATKPVKKHFDAIVFEGDLGMPHTQLIQVEKIQGIIRYLDDLYTRFFENLKSMKCRAPIVCALPFFRLRDGRTMDLSKAIEKIERLGFKKTELLSGKYVLKYFREDQAVGRAVYRFTI